MDGLGSAGTLYFEGFLLDRRAGCLRRVENAGTATPIALGSRALDLLTLLVGRRGELVSKDELLAAVWPGRVVEEANLNVQISKLRHILDQNRPQGSHIQTVIGYGYRFIGEVIQPEPPAITEGCLSSNSADELGQSSEPRGLGATGPSRKAGRAPLIVLPLRPGVAAASVLAFITLVAALVACLNWASSRPVEARLIPP